MKDKVDYFDGEEEIPDFWTKPEKYKLNDV